MTEPTDRECKAFADVFDLWIRSQIDFHKTVQTILRTTSNSPWLKAKTEAFLQDVARRQASDTPFEDFIRMACLNGAGAYTEGLGIAVEPELDGVSGPNPLRPPEE